MVQDIIGKLGIFYPLARCALEYRRDYELLFATRLSAQCTDARVNLVTPVLFGEFPLLEDLSSADTGRLEAIVRPCGFFRHKAADIKAAARMLLDDFGGRVPDTMEDLLRLPGVGRKTANLILGELYGKPAICADTHCIRLSNRLGLCETRDPYKVELKLKEVIPAEEQLMFCHRLIAHGRSVCKAQRPLCGQCGLTEYCLYFEKGAKKCP